MEDNKNKTKVDLMYDDLYEQGYLEKDRDTFNQFFFAPGEQGYKNRKALYDDLHEQGYLESPTYEDFAKGIGLHLVQQGAAQDGAQPQQVGQQTVQGNGRRDMVESLDKYYEGLQVQNAPQAPATTPNPASSPSLGGGGAASSWKDGQSIKASGSRLPRKAKQKDLYVDDKGNPALGTPEEDSRDIERSGLYYPLMRNDSINLAGTEAFKKGWLVQPKLDKNVRFAEARKAGYKAQGERFKDLSDEQLVQAMREEEKKLDGSTSPESLQASMNVRYIETLMAAREWGLGDVANFNATPYMVDYYQVKRQYNKNGLVDKYEKNMLTGRDDNPLLIRGWELIEDQYLKDEADGNLRDASYYRNLPFYDPKFAEEFGAYITARIKVTGERWNDAVKDAIDDFEAAAQEGRVGQRHSEEYLGSANREQVDDMLDRVNSALKKRTGELDDKFMNKSWFQRLGESSHDPENPSSRYLTDPDASNLIWAGRALQDAKKIIAAFDANRLEDGLTGFFKGAGRGLVDSLGDLSTWDGGISDLLSAQRLNAAVEKFKKGKPLSASEKALLEATSLKLATAEIFKEVGRGYKAGTVTGKSLPYMVEMALNPIAKSGNKIASGLAKYANKYWGKYLKMMVSKLNRSSAGRMATKMLGSGLAKNAGRVTARVVGDIGAAGGMAATSGLGRSAANAIGYHTGDVQYQQGAGGKTHFSRVTGGDDWVTSTLKGFGSTTIENASEMWGEYFKPVTNFLGSVSGKALEKMHLGAITRWLNDVNSTEMARLMSDFRKQTRWDGNIAEYFEEVAGNIANALTVKDMNFALTDKDGNISLHERNSVFNVDDNIDTFLGVSLMSGAMGAANIVGYRTPKYRAKQDVKRYGDMARGIFGARGNDWSTIETLIRDNSEEGRKQFVADLMQSGKYSKREKQAALQYAGAVYKSMGMDLGESKRSRSAGEQEAEEAYGRGYDMANLETIAETSSAYNQLRSQMEQEYGTELMERMDNEPGLVYGWVRAGAVSEEDAQKVLDYLNAKMAYEGAVDRLNDDDSAAKAAAESHIDDQVHTEENGGDGQIHPVTLKGRDGDHYVVSGNVVTDNDGNVDVNASDNEIVVVDSNGKRKMTTAKDIAQVGDTIDPNAAKAQAVASIESVSAQASGGLDTGANQVEGDETLDDTDLDSDEVAAPDGATQQDASSIQAPLPVTEYNQDDLVTVEVDGQQVDGIVTNGLDSNGNVTLYLEEPINGRQNVQLTPEQLNQVAVSYTSRDGETISRGETPQEPQQPQPQQQQTPTQEPAPVESKEVSTDEVQEQKEPTPANGSVESPTPENNEKPFHSYTSRNGKKVEWRTQTEEKDGVKVTRVVATADGKEVRMPAARFPMPKEYEIEKDSMPEDFDGKVEGVKELRETSEGAEATIVVSNRDGSIDEYEVRLLKKGDTPQPKNDMLPAAPVPEDKAQPSLPVGEDGNADFSNATPQEAHDYIYNDPELDEEEANQAVKNKLKGAQNRLDQAQAALDQAQAIPAPNMEDYGEDTAGYKRAKRERNEVIAQAQAAVDAAQRDVDLWNGVQAQHMMSRAANRAEQREQSVENPAAPSAPAPVSGESENNAPTPSQVTPPQGQQTTESTQEPSAEPSIDAAIVEAGKETNTEPTDAQKEAGNYKKGHVKIDGFDISIEQPKGSVRSGVDASGKEWSQKMNNTYGYIRGTEGVDGDHIDVFLSDDIDGWNGTVYVVDQVNNDGSFDEHKVMYGFNSEDDARQAYLSNYEDGWQGLGAITPVSKEEFKKWVDSSHRKTKPFAEYKNVKVEGEQAAEKELTPDERIERARMEALENRAEELAESCGLPVQVARSLDDLSDSHRRQVEKQHAEGKYVNGFYDPMTKQIVLFLPDIAKNGGLRRLERTFLHEGVAHGGLRALFENAQNGIQTFDELCDQVWEMMPVVAQAQMMNYIGVQKPEDMTQEKKRIAADEYMAHLAEWGVEPSVKSRIITAIKNALRKIGVKMKLSNNDIVSLLAASRRHLNEMDKVGINSAISEALDNDGEGDGEGVRMSTTAIFEGAGLEVSRDATDNEGKPTKEPLTDSKGNLVARIGDKEYSVDNPVTAADLKEGDEEKRERTVLQMLINDARAAMNITEKQADKIYQNYADLLNMYLYTGSAELGGPEAVISNWEWLGDSVFRTIAANGDAQYSYSMDIIRVCKKNEAVIKAMSALQLREGRGATPSEIVELYRETHEDGYQVPCPVCYVFTRYIRNGKYASAAIKGMEEWGDHLPGGSKVWSVDQWLDALDKIQRETNPDYKPDGKNKMVGKELEKAQRFKKQLDQANKITVAYEKRVNALSYLLTTDDAIKAGTIKNKKLELTPERRASIEKELDIINEQYQHAVEIIAHQALSNWIKTHAIEEKDGKWQMREDARKPEDIDDYKRNALDLRLTSNTIVNYPAIQRLRKSGGSAAGKEISFASDNRLGEVVSGLGINKSNLSGYKNKYEEALNATGRARNKARNEARKRFKDATVYALMQTLRGGQRMWSWSDNIERLSPDIAINIMQLQLLGGAMQTYSKQLEGIKLAAQMGAYVNGSLMAKDNGYQEVTDKDVEERDGKLWLKHDIPDEVEEYPVGGGEPKPRKRIVAAKGSYVYQAEDGKKYVLIYDDVVGVDPFGNELHGKGKKKGLFQLNQEYDRAGNILVGMNDLHVRAAMADPRVFFIIPWHASGANNHILNQMLNILEQNMTDRLDYTAMQEEKNMLERNKNTKELPEVNQRLRDLWEEGRQWAKQYKWKSGMEVDSNGDVITESQYMYRQLRALIFNGNIFEAMPSEEQYRAAVEVVNSMQPTVNAIAARNEQWKSKSPEYKKSPEGKAEKKAIEQDKNRTNKKYKEALHYIELHDGLIDWRDSSQHEGDAEWQAQHPKRINVEEARRMIEADEFLSQVLKRVEPIGHMTNGDNTYIYPYEYWQETDKKGKPADIKEADINGKRYVEYCRRMGYKPKFSGRWGDKVTEENMNDGNFVHDPGYWKLLIDRRMYDRKGKYQWLDPVESENFEPDLVNPLKTGEEFNITQVADDKDAEDIAERVYNNMAERDGGVAKVDYSKPLEQIMDEYDAALSAGVQANVKLTEAEEDALDDMEESMEEEAGDSGVLFSTSTIKAPEASDALAEYEKIHPKFKLKDGVKTLERYYKEGDIESLRIYRDSYMDSVKTWERDLKKDLKDGFYETSVVIRDDRAMVEKYTKLKDYAEKLLADLVWGRDDYNPWGVKKNAEVGFDELDDLFARHNDDVTNSELWDRVLAVSRRLGVDNIKFKQLAKDEAGAAMGGRIRYQADYYNDYGVPDHLKTETLLHEMIHHVTSYAIRHPENLTADQKDAVERIKEVWMDIKFDPDFKGTYGITNPSEMVAELSNPGFRDKLKSKTYWEKLIDGVLRLLGIEREGANMTTAYDVVRRNLERLLSDPNLEAYNKHAETQRQFSPRFSTSAVEVSEQQPEVDGGLRFSVREKPEPKKTIPVYKLMRLGDDGKLYPLFIDGTEPIELGVWYDADSPNMDMLVDLPIGVHLIDTDNGTSMTMEEYVKQNNIKLKKGQKYPPKEVIESTSNGQRWVYIEPTERGQRRFGGESRRYWNLGINGSGSVSTFSMRPGWHAGSLPTMRQIGKGAKKNLRDDRFVWVEGLISADIDYNEEAQRNPDNDIPTHIPTDGFYMKATNANAKASQADRVGWYISGAFMPVKIMSDSEARQVIDKWNADPKHADLQVEYDFPRESGKVFNAETMQLEDEANVRFSTGWHGSGSEFDRFDHSHMGEGEGAQAYGWGTYITSVEGIGRSYATESAKKNPTYYWKGQQIDRASINPLSMAYDVVEREGTIKKAISLVDRFLDNPDAHENWAEVKEILKQSKKSDFTKKPARYLYEVDIPDNNGENYISWDRTLPKGHRRRIATVVRDLSDDLLQRNTHGPNWLRGGVEQLANMIEREQYAGKDIVEKLRDAIGDSKRTSEIFYEAGFVGIEYPAQYMSGGRKDGSKNYVIFNADDAKIVDRTRFSLSPGEKAQGGTYFSGGGLIESGLEDVLDKRFGVEYDEKIAGVYKNNHGEHIVVADVRNVDPMDMAKRVDGPVQYFHASPVCKNASKLKKGAETELDKETATSTAKAIEKMRPRIVTIENVAGYKDFDSFKIITDKLDELGYTYDTNVVNAADYGAATNRERLILRAVADGYELPPLPEGNKQPTSWYSRVEDLIPDLKKTTMPRWIDERLKNGGIDWQNVDEPLLVFGGSGDYKKMQVARRNEPAPTLAASGSSDDRVILPGGDVREVTPRLLARIMGLPDSYQLPWQKGLAHTILGNGVPVELTKGVIEPLVRDVADAAESIRFSTSAAVDALKDDERVYNDLLGKVFSGVSNETRRGIVEDAMRNRGNDFGAATEAWLGGLADDGKFADVDRRDWGKVKLALHQELMDNGVDVSEPLTDGESRYVLWKAGQIEDGVFSMAEDVVMRDRLLPGESGVRFSTSPAEQVYSDNFKDWFGDWENDPENASKVVDEDGRPLVVYHGSFKDFNIFKGGFFTDSRDVADSYSSDSGRLYEVYLDIKNPIVIDNPDSWNRIWLTESEAHRYGIDGTSTLYEHDDVMEDAIRERNEQTGENWIVTTADDLVDAMKNSDKYDGVIIKDVYGDMFDGSPSEGPHTEYIPKDPTQIKSATENNGDFSRENPDIRFSTSAYDVIKAAREAASGEPQGNGYINSTYHRGEIAEGSNAGEKYTIRISDHPAKWDNFVYSEDEDLDGRVLSIVITDDPEYINEWKGRGLDEITDRDGYNVEQYILNADDVNTDMLTAAIENFKKTGRSYGMKDGEIIGIQESGDGIQFSVTPRGRAIARDQYERYMRNGRLQWVEANQDSMLGLKKLMQAIMGNAWTKVEDVAMYENPYIAENLMSSVTAAQQQAFYTEFMKPLLEEVGKLCKGGKKAREKAREELTNYLMAKHGLERNQVLADRDAQETAQAGGNYQDAYAENREHDYSGLTALTGEDDVHAAEAKAQQMVDDYEAQHDTTELWSRINAATQVTLEKQYKSGMLSYAEYQRISGMFDYYVPLRGWEETTSDEVYGYLTSKAGPFLGGGIMKRAGGRTSKADDPIATIAQMGDDSIRTGNRNLMKQTFLNFVQNHPSDLVSVSDLWLQYDVVTDEWVPVFADIDPNDSADVVEQKIQDFEQRMQELAEQEPDKYKHGREAANIPYRVIPGMEKEHQVLVKRNGQTWVLTINGNPRAAQALNGLTNPDVPMEGAWASAIRGAEWVNRTLSALYTTLSPAFIVSNFLRDSGYSNTMVWVRESPNYALRFNRNYLKLNPATLRFLLGRWENGTLDENKPLQKHFKEFMLNGGETGFAMVKDLDKYKKDLLNEVKNMNSRNFVRKGMKIVGSQYELLGRSIENCARFAAYVTSREMGRDVKRSAYDAKEISVNFNKKGSGGKSLGKVGQTMSGNVGAFVSGMARSLYTFWNAGVQGMTNSGRAIKRHPVKAALMGVGPLYAAGFLAPILAQMMGAGGDGDDDKNAYYNLPEYVRRSNLCIWLGDAWLTIPLPIEFRSIYGMGELTYGAISGNERYSDEELAMQIIGQFSQLLPIDMLEGGGGFHPFIPTLFKPIVEAEQNKSWSGLPIYRDSEWNKDDPEYTKAFSNANEWIVSGAEWLNAKTGGDEFKKGWIDLNPAKIEYMLKGYLGGIYTTIDEVRRAAETALGERDFEWRNIPLANRVIKQGDERTESKKLRDEYFNYKEDYEETKRLINKYKNAEDTDLFDYAKKLDLLNNSKEYGRYLIFEKYATMLEAYQKAKKGASGEVLKKIEEDEKVLMRQLVDEMHAFEDGKITVGNRPKLSKKDRSEDYGYMYNNLRTYVDINEDALLDSSLKRAKASGDKGMAAALSSIKRSIGEMKKGLGRGNDDKVMDSIRRMREGVLRSFGLLDGDEVEPEAEPDVPETEEPQDDWGDEVQDNVPEPEDDEFESFE